MTNDLYIQPHLGLGDSIICCGMVRELSKKYDRIVWPCKWRNYPSVKHMFSDLSNVIVMGVEGDQESSQWSDRFQSGGTEVLKLGCFSKEKLNLNSWDRQFYANAGVDFEARWKSFSVPKIAGHPEPVAFVHDAPDTGSCINDHLLPAVFKRVPILDTVFHCLSWLQSCPEIHVIDSSLLCLADTVSTSATRLVFHRYARPSRFPPTLLKQWEVIT